MQTKYHCQTYHRAILPHINISAWWIAVGINFMRLGTNPVKCGAVDTSCTNWRRVFSKSRRRGSTKVSTTGPSLSHESSLCLLFRNLTHSSHLSNPLLNFSSLDEMQWHSASFVKRSEDDLLRHLQHFKLGSSATVGALKIELLSTSFTSTSNSLFLNWCYPPLALTIERKIRPWSVD